MRKCHQRDLPIAECLGDKEYIIKQKRVPVKDSSGEKTQTTQILFFFFLILGLELRAYTLNHSTSPFL
jgi:hypothetical protein